MLALTSSAFAQSDESFAGKWELVGLPENIGFRLQKSFDGAGGFANYRLTKTVLVKTHFGKYMIKDSVTYTEIVSKETDGSRMHVAGQTTTILYKFSDDMKFLTLRGLAVNGNTDFLETWKRIEEPIVAFIYKQTNRSQLALGYSDPVYCQKC